jgi:hypothetical protein
MVRANIIRASTGAVAGIALAIAAWNYIAVSRPAGDAVRADPRNHSVKIRTHFRFYLDRTTLIFDLRSVSLTTSPADVFRIFLQTASALKARRFERVELAHRGSTKFIIRGDYFRQVGNEYGRQNPIYTIRTFPEHVYRLDGTAAYPSWSGGWIGVMNRQMEDFADVHRTWYLDDLVGSLAKNSPDREASQAQDRSSSHETVAAEATTRGPEDSPSTYGSALSNSLATSSTGTSSGTVGDGSSESLNITSDATARSLTFADRVKTADAAPKFYLDERAQTYHTLNCSVAKPSEMYIVNKPIVQLRRYPPHSCVVSATSSLRR